MPTENSDQFGNEWRLDKGVIKFCLNHFSFLIKVKLNFYFSFKV